MASRTAGLCLARRIRADDKIIVAFTSTGLYAMGAYVDPAAAVSVGILAIVFLVLSVSVGVARMDNKPSWAAWLIQAWSLLVIVVVSGAVAIGIYLASILVVGEKPEAEEKALMGAFAAAVALVVTSIQDFLNKYLAPWFSHSVIAHRYSRLFPCTPEGDGAGRRAQKALSQPYSAGAWNRASTQKTLEDIQAAKATGQHHGGANWKCLEEPPNRETAVTG